MATFNFNGNRASGNSGCASRIFTVPFFLIFLAFGLFFSWLILHDLARTLGTWRWPTVSCTILQSHVIDEPKKDDPFRVSVRYAYAYNGRHYTSDQYQRTPQRESDYAKAARIVQRYPAGRHTTCRVNPADPSQAILQTNSLWIGLFLVIPLVFVLVGGGGVYFSIRPKRKTPQPLAPSATQQRWGKKALYGFFTVFLLIGLGVFWAMGRDVLRQWSAAQWQPTSAQVIWSAVRAHSGKHGDTYSVDIFYRYEVNGQTYKSNRYRFLAGSSSGYDGKKAIVRQYPRGKKITVYVNPADPIQAVIDRSLGYDLLILLLPLVFVAVGAGGLIGVGWHARRQARQSPREAWLPRPASSMTSSSTSSPLPRAASPKRPLVLRAKQGPMFKFLSFTLFAVGWNGVISLFLSQVYRGWQSGHPDACLTVFMIPFVLVGLGSIGLIGYSFSALFNPRITLTLGQQDLALGDATQLTWTFTGRYDKVQRLIIRLEGRELATYSSGKSTNTSKSVFANTTLADTTQSYEIRKGSASLAIPADTMHSFAAPHNQIAWFLVVQGEIPRWADVRQEFPLTILPLPLPQEQPLAAEAS